MLSVVIPTYRAAAELPAAIRAVSPHVGEVVVADGGSDDGTPEVAAREGARVVTAPRGRGRQLAAGAAAAAGEWLLFLHADTRLSPPWAEAAAAFMGEGANRGRAGFFRFALADGDPAARRLERMVAWRSRVLGLPYGDQGLLLERGFYDHLGGFSPLPLMEDVDLVRRIGRRRLAGLAADAVTSAGRYRREGYLRRPLRNLFCLALYFAGVAPERISRFYQ